MHADAATLEQTDWSQIVALYDQLLAVAPTPVVALNRAIAIGEVQGPAAALALVDELDLDNYHPFHATRADLLRRLGRTQRGRGRLRARRRPGADGRRAGLPQARRPSFALSDEIGPCRGLYSREGPDGAPLEKEGKVTERGDRIDVTVAAIDEMEPIHGGLARRARATLGVPRGGCRC